MGHHSKLEPGGGSSGSSPSGTHHSRHHRHHHHSSSAHHHHHQAAKMREPSVHSFSSSEISPSEISSDASSVHHRSTPKIAAVIIAAIIVIAGLVGLTVYLVDGDRLAAESRSGRLEVVEEDVELLTKDTALDFQTYRDETASVMQKHQMAEDGADPRLLNHQVHLNRFRQRQQDATRIRERKDPEGPIDLNDLYEYYEDPAAEDDAADDQKPNADRSHPASRLHKHDRHLIHHHHHQGKNKDLFGSTDFTGDGGVGMMSSEQRRRNELLRKRQRQPVPTARVSLTDDEEGADAQMSRDATTTTAQSPTSSGDNRRRNYHQRPAAAAGASERPYGERIAGEERRKSGGAAGMSDLYDMSLFQDLTTGQNDRTMIGNDDGQEGLPPHRPRPHSNQQGMQGQHAHPMRGAAMRNRQRIVRPPSDPADNEGLRLDEGISEEDLERPPLPPNGSRGGINVPVSRQQQQRHPPLGGGGSSGITTLDRRPGRPAFHHMGPPSGNSRFGAGGRPSSTFRQRQRLYELRRQQSMLQRRLGMIAQQQKEAPVSVAINPVAEAHKLLRNFDGIVEMAKSEVAVIRDIARNITDSGKELNLWEVMSAVNSTLRDRPGSPLTRLMNRFYSKYLSEEGLAQAAANNSVSPTYEKSLSSLLFLSFGIFLLNSVNDIIRERGLAGEGQSRSFGTDSDALALKALIMSEEEMAEKIVPAKSGEEEATVEDSKPTVNGYLRLLMNLMNAYQGGREEDVECIWSLYCHQLNKQARLGGMVSAVARINSVGMRVMLKAIPSDRALGTTLSALASWRDVPCQEMFPQCGKSFEEGESTEAEKT